MLVFCISSRKYKNTEEYKESLFQSQATLKRDCVCVCVCVPVLYQAA